jgi:hypothetical protein
MLNGIVNAVCEGSLKNPPRLRPHPCLPRLAKRIWRFADDVDADTRVVQNLASRTKIFDYIFNRLTGAIRGNVTGLPLTERHDYLSFLSMQ